MRTRKISMLAIAAVAAGLSLTACGPNGTGDADGHTAPPGQQQDQGGGSAAQGGGSASQGGGQGSQKDPAKGSNASQDHGSGSAASGSMCKTSNLSFSTSGGMGEGQLIINMKNVGGSTCTMHGFAGVDLKGKDGTESATRSDRSAPDVRLAPGEGTNFFLYAEPNTSGGSGITFTTLVVTPPNETHSVSLPVSVNVAVTDGSSGHPITIDPVGTGK